MSPSALKCHHYLPGCGMQNVEQLMLSPDFILASWPCGLVWYYSGIIWTLFAQNEMSLMYLVALYDCKYFDVYCWLCWGLFVRHWCAEVLDNKAADGERMACSLSARLIESLTDHEKQRQDLRDNMKTHKYSIVYNIMHQWKKFSVFVVLLAGS